VARFVGIGAIGALGVLVGVHSSARIGMFSLRSRTALTEVTLWWGAKVDVPDRIADTLDWGARNLSRVVSLCAEFDDDAIAGPLCSCSDLHWECEEEMLKSNLYYDSCFEASCPKALGGKLTCSGGHHVGASWANLCSWQMIRDLPLTCNGSFVPETPFLEPSSDLPNAYPDLDDLQREAVGYSESMGGPCAFHSFCFTCLDSSFPSGVNPFCAAVYLNYGGTPTHTDFFSQLDGPSGYCQPEVIASILEDAGVGDDVLRRER